MTHSTIDGRPRSLDALPAVLSVAMVASLLGVCARTIRRWIAEGRLPAARTARGGSGRLLIRAESLRRFLDEGTAA